MLRRLYAALSPSLKPELREYRTRLGRGVIQAYLVVLGAWLLSLLASPLLGGAYTPSLSFDLGGIAFLGLATVVSFYFLRRGRVVLVSYLMSAAMFLVLSLGLGSEPGMAPLVAAMFLLPVLTAGSLAGGGPALLFALAAIAVSAFAWLSGRPEILSLSGGLNGMRGAIFLFSLSVAVLATAGILHILSRQMQGTIDTLRDQADRMTRLAHTDALTGLANRRQLIQQLEREFARARRYRRPLSLLYLDLDGFKEINDRFGHLFGDDLLRGAARSMQSILRATDLLARIGGDEFAVLLPETNLEGAKKVSAKLSRALAAYSRHLGPAVPELTFCAGVAKMRDEDETVDDILARADEAQYLAKETGKAHTRTELELESAGES